MAKAKAKIEVELILTEREALYIREVLQGPMDVEEAKEHGDTRSSIWRALDGVLKNAQL